MRADKPFAFLQDAEPIISDMKRNFVRYMTKLGAHVTHLAVRGAEYTKNAAGLLTRRIGELTAPRRSRIADYFKNIKANRLMKRTARRNARAKWRGEIRDIYRKKGILSAFRTVVSSSFRFLWERKGAVVSVFNWAAPALSIMFLVSVVSYASNLNYGISVEYNGQTLGIIAEEGDYEDAERTMQERIVYVEGNETVTLSPTFSVQVVEDTDEIVNSYQLADKMIANSDTKLTEAYGMYIDGNFVGALTEKDREPVMQLLADMKAEYDSPDVTSISFDKEIEYQKGLYLENSLIPTENVVDMLTETKQKEATYTVVKGDAPIKIAKKNNITLEELRELNPEIDKKCVVGQEVLLKREESFLSVVVTKELNYTEQVDYETEEVKNSNEYQGSRTVLVKGEEGEAEVVAEAEYIDGYEVGRTIISRVVTKEPVTQRVSVGTKTPKPIKGPVITGNGKYLWPVAGGYISSYFADTAGRGGKSHKGLDIAAPYGTAIFAADAGTVTMSKWYSGYGKCIMITHDDGTVTLYGHCSTLIAKYGQRVEKGEVIALVGSTGNSTGNHCHFEVRSGGRYLNPLNYIK